MMNRTIGFFAFAACMAIGSLVVSSQTITHVFPGAIEGRGGMKLIDTTTNADIPNYVTNSSHEAASGYLGGLYYQLLGVNVAAVRAREYVTNEYGLGFFTFNVEGMVERCKITGAGQFLCAKQPGFFATNSTTDSNVATLTTIDFNNEIYDEANNFANDTFTAPITARYLLCTNVEALVDTTPNYIVIYLQTSNRTIEFEQTRADAAVSFGLGGCVHADMDAGDTAFVNFDTPSATTDINGGAQAVTWFSGRLVP